MLWRFSANHTQLYPGAQLRNLDDSSGIQLSSGDEMLAEFSDGVPASGRLLAVDKGVVVLDMPTYRTQRGTDVAPRIWRLVPADERGVMQVQRHVPAV